MSVHVLIIGATSAIAQAYARREAVDGARFFLLSRDAGRQETVAADLRVRGAVAVGQARLDVLESASHAGALDAAWAALGRVDVVLLAHGTLPDQARCEAFPDYAREQFDANGSATIALMAAIAPRLRAQGSGTLAVISSVAGDRGRASNYLYGSAKAAVSTFASGLRQALAGTGVNVLTIKPGFVDTPMTAQFKKGALWASPDQVAAGIQRAIARRRGESYLPGFWRPIMFVIRHIPEFVFRRIRL
jgi:decaprenylphospho-beta-D-erythro-pentofuranosid-2-ulose 2-reductase